jgi:hypothetical protein
MTNGKASVSMISTALWFFAIFSTSGHVGPWLSVAENSYTKLDLWWIYGGYMVDICGQLDIYIYVLVGGFLPPL